MPEKKTGAQKTKEALLAESLLCVDSTCFRQLALEQANERLLAGVRLGEHRCSSLLQDLEAGQLTALGSHIDVDDAAVRGFEIDGVDVQEVLSKVDAAHFGAVLSAHVSDLLQSHLNYRDKFIRVSVSQYTR